METMTASKTTPATKPFVFSFQQGDGHDKKLLGGCVVIEGAGKAISQVGWRGELYRRAAAAKTKAVRIKAVPYHLWDNRQPGTMTVFMSRA